MGRNLIGRTLGDFRLDEQIGQGAMGKVFRATQLSLGRAVAIKVLEIGIFTFEEWKERFVREVEFLARLEHPNIVPVYTTGNEEGLLYFAMRLVQGATLAERMMAGIAPAEGARILADVCGALAYAHAQGIIHRDVKPANVLLAGDTPLLTDFGLARLVEATTITGSGALLGTPRYLAPEQARREKATPQSDLFPVGVMLYEIATGRHPFDPEGGERLRKDEYVQRVAMGEILPPRRARVDLPEPLEAFLLRAMANDPNDRPAGATEMRAELLALASRPEVATLAAATLVPLPPRSSRVPSPPSPPSPASTPGRAAVAAPVSVPSADSPPAQAAVPPENAVPVAPHTDSEPARGAAPGIGPVQGPQAARPDPPGTATAPHAAPAAGSGAGPPTRPAAGAASAPAAAREGRGSGGGTASPVEVADGVAQVHESVGRAFGKFLLREPLGEGGMGVVYKAEQTDLGRCVALKMLREEDNDKPTAVARFEAEARSAARLRHPGIIPIHEVGEIEGRRYFTMDWIEGEDLDRALSGGPLPPNRALQILRDVARAVHHAHEQGVVHRDLKPGNILVEKGGRVLVGDFGIARDLQVDRRRLSVTGDILGTPGYMAPEQARGTSHEIGPHSDVFALGAVLYHMIAGRPPYTGDGAIDVWLGALEAKFPPPRAVNPRVHKDVETICLAAMAEAPARRYASAAALADDCERFLRGEPILARPPGLAYRAGKALMRHRGATAAAVAGLLAIAALLAGLLPALGAQRRELAVRAALEPLTDAIQDARPHLYIAGPDLFDKLRAVESAVARLEALAQAPEIAESATVWALIGQGRQFLGQDARAEAAYLRAEGLDSRSEPVRRGLARIYLERALLGLLQGQRESRASRRARSEAWREEGLRRLRGTGVGNAPGEDLERDVLEAMHQFSEGTLAATRRLCEEGLQRFGDRMGTEEFWNLLAQTAIGPERIRLLDQALGRRPHYAWALFARGMMRDALGERQAALADFDAALRLRPEFFSAWLHRGLVHSALGDDAGALSDYEAALRLNPRSPDAHHDRAVVLLRLNREDEARAELAAAVGLDDGYASPLLALANLARKRGDLKGALAHIDLALAAEPENSSARVLRGAVLQVQGQRAEAIAEYTEALRLDPRSAAALANRALARLDLGDRENALADAEAAVQAEPLLSEAWAARARARDLAGDRKGASADHDRALELDPKSVPARINRAAFRREEGDHASALDDLNRAVETAPADVDARRHRAFVLRLLGRADEARVDLDEAARLRPEDPEVWHDRGVLLYGQKKYDEAIADLDRCLLLAPRHAKAWFNRAQAWWGKGELTRAIDDLGRATGADAKYDLAFFTRGYLLEQLGRPEEAYASYDAAVQLGTRLAKAWIGRGNLRGKRGDRAGQIADYEQAVRLAQQQGDSELAAQLEAMLQKMRK